MFQQSSWPRARATDFVSKHRVQQQAYNDIQNVSDVTICTNSDQNKHERPLIKKTESMNDQFQRTDQQPHGSAMHDYL